MPAFVKEFHEYIDVASIGTVTLEDYRKSPACAFLKFAVGAKDAASMCQRQFKKKGARKYSAPALDSLHMINAGLLASIMGNFETFQKYLFADMFEYSMYLNKFSVKEFLKHLSSKLHSSEVLIDLERFAAYRNNPVGVGLIIADNLKNWQSPSIVNDYFAAFGLKDVHGHPISFYSNDSRKRLAVLWQMRHSIVHTAGTITLPDSQKIGDLNSFGNRVIALQPQFIYEVARKFHPIVKEAMEHMKSVYIVNLRPDIPADLQLKIENVFKVSSSCSAWLV